MTVSESKLPAFLRGHGDAKIVSRPNTRGTGKTWHLEFSDSTSYDTAYQAGGSQGYRQGQIAAMFK